MKVVEFLSQRTNAHIDPVMTLWRWEIPLYLFLGGLVAGLMIIGTLMELYWPEKWDKRLSIISPIVAIAMISIGMFALLLGRECCPPSRTSF